MKRSLQEVVELVVFGLIALLLGTGLLWLVGAVFGLVGTVLGWLAGLLWALLRFVVPVALIAGAVVLLIRAVRGRGDAASAPTGTRVASPTSAPTVNAAPLAPAAMDPAPVPEPTEDAVPAPDAPAHDAPAEDAPDSHGEVDAGDADPDRRQD